MRGYRAVALTASVAIFMQYLDSTAINTAVPAIARDFAIPAIRMDIAIIAYQLALVVFIPFGTVLAGRIGARNAFIAALLIFMSGSIFASLSGSLTELVAARGLEGLGGAVMMPVSRLLVLRSAEKSELISAMNWLVIPGVIGPMMGPAVGGFLVTYASWHAIFLVNVPIALIGVAATILLVPDTGHRSDERFDRRGVTLMSVLTVCFVLGLGGAVGPRPLWITVALLGTSALFGWAYWRHYRTAEAPVIDLSLFSIATFRHSMVAGTMMRIIASATGFILPLWFQLTMGMTAARTGSLMMMSALGAMIVRILSGTMLRHVHPHSLTKFGAGSFVLALLGTATLRQGWPLPVFHLLLLLQGMTLSIGLLVLSPVAYVDIPAERLAAATSFYTTTTQLSLSLGVVSGVWAIGLMRFMLPAGEHDPHVYMGAIAILALIATWAALIGRQVDREAMGSLRPKRATA